MQQYVAYLDRRMVEVALDYFAQADDGSVWYFGEAVSNYKDGVVADHEGSWIAGKDGPPGMIMPAHPKRGDVYRPENIPGLVFEEDTVQSAGATVDGPRGRVEGAIVVREHLMDNTFEDKVFAPGYAEFQTRGGGRAHRNRPRATGRRACATTAARARGIDEGRGRHPRGRPIGQLDRRLGRGRRREHGLDRSARRVPCRRSWPRR